MKVYKNGYGDTVKEFELGDRAIFTSSKWKELAPYEVTINGIYAEMDHGHPAYLRYIDANGNQSGWELYYNFAPID